MALSATDKMMVERIERDFTYHPPTDHKAESYKSIRATGKALALDIVARCPDCRERSLALTKIEEAVMWANAGIARSD